MNEKLLNIKALAFMVKQKRKEKGLSLQALAAKLGNVPSASTISVVERALRSPDALTLASLAEWLELPIGRFYPQATAITARGDTIGNIATAINGDKTLDADAKVKLTRLMRVTYQALREIQV